MTRDHLATFSDRPGPLLRLRLLFLSFRFRTGIRIRASVAQYLILRTSSNRWSCADCPGVLARAAWLSWVLDSQLLLFGAIVIFRLRGCKLMIASSILELTTILPEGDMTKTTL